MLKHVHVFFFTDLCFGLGSVAPTAVRITSLRGRTPYAASCRSASDSDSSAGIEPTQTSCGLAASAGCHCGRNGGGGGGGGASMARDPRRSHTRGPAAGGRAAERVQQTARHPYFRQCDLRTPP